MVRCHPGSLGKTMGLGKVRLFSSLARRDRGEVQDRNVSSHQAIKVFPESGIVGSLRIASRGLHSGRYKVQGSPQRWESFVVPPSSTVLQTQKSPFLSCLSPPTRARPPAARACRQRIPTPPVRGIPGHRGSAAPLTTRCGARGLARGEQLFLEHMEEKIQKQK